MFDSAAVFLSAPWSIQEKIFEVQCNQPLWGGRAPRCDGISQDSPENGDVMVILQECNGIHIK